MKKQILYWAILILPFLGMIMINELFRLSINEEGYTKQGVTAINTAKKQNDQCTWICHEITNYCKENHVKLAKPYFDKIDPIYFGIISSLKSTGGYRLSNLILFVIVLPLIMYVLLVKSISLEFKIRKLNNG